MRKNLQASIRDFQSGSLHRLIFPAAFLLALSLAACSTSSESSREAGGGEHPGEHGGAGEGREGAESGGGGGEESATQYDRTDTYWNTRAGARLVLRYDDATQGFTGTATNITGDTLPRVRVEVHLSNGQELGPTTPVDLAPGETIAVNLPAPGEVFTTWGAHPEVGREGASARMAAFTPGFGNWAVVNGVDLGIENPVHRMSAWYSTSGNARTPRLSPDPTPQHQPTGAATWTGEWAGFYGTNPAIATGVANVTVTLGTTGPEAVLALKNVPTLGSLEWEAMPVAGGRFTGTTTANSQAYDVAGQFGGDNQAGVVGYTTGPDFQSVFYGDKN